MKRARVIYNPTSGKERLKKQLPYILSRLEQAGYEASAHQTTGPGCAQEAARVACERRYDLVIAAGGDGTLFEVINGLAEQEYRPTLGIIPGGTTNDFARALGIPFKIEKAVDVICEGDVSPIDVGKVDGRSYFINVAAGGILTELTYEVPIKLKTIFGRFAYFMKAFTKLFKIRSTNVRMTFEDGVYERDVFLFLICNTESVGGYSNIAVNSKVDDGKFDVIFFEKMRMFRVFRILMRLIMRKPIKSEHVKYFQLSDFQIELKRDLPLNLDGEYGGHFPCRFVNLKHHLNLMIPKGK